jgi:hypothetical protein
VTVPVYVELGAKRVFAGALAWPGWIRAGRTESHALDALAAAAERYAVVAELAGLALPTAEFEVVERVEGNATTDFGAPSAILQGDRTPLTAKEAQRLADLVGASWTYLDDIVAAAPAALRKGPRGGGRDRDKIVDHVVGAEEAYAGKLGIRRRDLPPDEAGPGSAVRAALLNVLGVPSTGEPLKERGPEAPLKAPGKRWPAPLKAPGKRWPAPLKAPGKRWPARYAARRIAWHALDHAWEIEDRST